MREVKERAGLMVASANTAANKHIFVLGMLLLLLYCIVCSFVGRWVSEVDQNFYGAFAFVSKVPCLRR